MLRIRAMLLVFVFMFVAAAKANAVNVVTASLNVPQESSLNSSKATASGIVAASNDGHPRSGWVGGRGDVERVDVEAAPAEQSRDAREHTELVLDQDGDRMPHEGWGSVLAIPGQDLHHLVLPGELELLEALLLELLLGGQVVLLLVAVELPLQVRVFLVVAPELGLSLQQGLDQFLILLFHRMTPASVRGDL